MEEPGGRRQGSKERKGILETLDGGGLLSLLEHVKRLAEDELAHGIKPEPVHVVADAGRTALPDVILDNADELVDVNEDLGLVQIDVLLCEARTPFATASVVGAIVACVDKRWIADALKEIIELRLDALGPGTICSQKRVWSEDGDLGRTYLVFKSAQLLENTDDASTYLFGLHRHTFHEWHRGPDGFGPVSPPTHARSC